MKRLFAFLLLFAVTAPALARYEMFLNTSPNNKYRVAITQEILRRVGDRVFFQYPIYVTDKKGAKLFRIEYGTVPLVSETERGTFQIDHGRVRFDWAKDSGKLFFHLEVSENEWRVLLVDIAKRKARDITDDLAPKMAKKVRGKGWVCQRPAVELVKWHKPHQAVFHLTTICSTPGDVKQESLTAYEDWVLYDTAKGKLLKECPGCKEEKGIKVVTKEPPKKKPTPTPTPEETPTYW